MMDGSSGNGGVSGRKRARGPATHAATQQKASQPRHKQAEVSDIDDEEAALEAAVFGSHVEVAKGAAAKSAPPRQAAAAWQDDDEEEIEVDITTVSRLRKLRQSEGETKVDGTTLSSRLRARKALSAAAGPGRVHWSERRGEERRGEEGSDEEGRGEDLSDGEKRGEERRGEDMSAKFKSDLLRSTAALVEEHSVALQFGKLSISRVRDANRADPTPAVLQSASFHPYHGNVMFTAGLDKKLRFFNIDGKVNAKISTVFFDDMPISTATWMNDGNEVLVCGRRPFFYSYDIAAGSAIRVPRIGSREDKSWESAVAQETRHEDSAIEPLISFLGHDGSAVLVSQRTKTWVSNLKMTGAIRAAAFIPSASGTGYDDLLTAGTEGEVYRWDLRTMRCIQRHVDEGSTGVTTISATKDGKRYAVGSNMGVVNIYDGADSAMSTPASGIRGLFSATTAPKPMHTIMTLTTSISVLQYSNDGAILAMGSQRNRDSFRMVHAASGKTFGNWPTSKTPLGYVTCASFSPNTGYVTLGNDKGRALLYRLNHYSEA